MENGFLKVAAVTPKIRVADVKYNADLIIDSLKEAYLEGARIIVFPELCLTSYTCADLFSQQLLLNEAKSELKRIAIATKDIEALIFIVLPI